MNQKEFDEILHRYLNNACSNQEKIFVENWFENIQHEDLFIPQVQELKAKDKIWNHVKK